MPERASLTQRLMALRENQVAQAALGAYTYVEERYAISELTAV